LGLIKIHQNLCKNAQCPCQEKRISNATGTELGAGILGGNNIL
jgi:hypothetical protein